MAQCLGDRRKQRLLGERFAKEPAYSLSPRLISNLMATRDQENRQLSMRLPDDPAEFEAADPGHAHLGDQQVHVRKALRSEEHTSELQSLMRIWYAVSCLTEKH